MRASDAARVMPATGSDSLAGHIGQWAESSGTAPALGELTYGALSRRVGGGPSAQDPVTALPADPRPDTIVAALATLDGGAALIGSDAPARHARPGELVLPIRRADGSVAPARFPQSGLIRLATALGERYALSPTDRVWIDGSLSEPGTWLILAASFVAGAHVLQGPEGASVAWLLNGGVVPEGDALRLVHLNAPRDRLAALQSDRPGLTLVNGFALPEAGGLPVCSDPRDPPASVPTTLGRPLRGMEVMIVDPRTGMDMLLYQTGEVWLRGPGIMAGFADGAASFEQGRFLRTGILGHLDSEGRLVLPRTEEDTLRIGHS